MGANNNYFKVNTVEQFKVLKYINVNFQDNALELELVKDNAIVATDCNGQKILFFYDYDEHKVKSKDKL